MAKTSKKGLGMNLTTGIITIALTLLGAVLYFMSHTTNYYTFGQMNSATITALLICALLSEAAALIFVKKFPDALWAKCLTFLVTALLAAAAILIVGDRVEGIGNCIVTDYDSGHGGEEAIYMSLIGAVCMLAAMIYNIIGSFEKDGNAPAGTVKKFSHIISASAIGLAAIIATVMLTGAGLSGSSGGAGTGGAADSAAGVYKISYNQGNENLEGIPDYQFLSSSMAGLAKADARFYIDITLNLDGKGSYSLLSDGYVLEAGKRAEIGDPSGLGLVYTTKAEGTYVQNEDGTVTTSSADHAVFEVKTDTYSAQMKNMMHIDLNGGDEDGVYDSADCPAVLDYVPETVWTLADGAIVTYSEPALHGTFTISYNQGNENLEDIPDYQFLSSSMAGLAKADARFYIDLALTLDGTDRYTLFADGYVLEAGKRAEIGDPSGLGLVYTTSAEGSYVENEDGTVTTSPAEHAVFEVKTDTYSAQMKQMMHIDLNGGDEDGVYDSADCPAVLDYVPETIWTLSGDSIVTYESAEVEEEETEDAPVTDTPAAAEAASVEIPSDDGATKMVFSSDGSYRFLFESYNIEDAGTYAYTDGVLTLTDANGKQTTADGDPMHLQYAYSQSDQLTGAFTIPAADLAFEAAAEAPAEETASVEVPSNDGATRMVFSSGGTYSFFFDSYNIEDAGTFTFADGVLTLTDANGKETKAEGDPLEFTYAYSQSDQLTGAFTVPAADLTFEAAAEEPAQEAEADVQEEPAEAEVKSVEILSNDGATRMVFSSNGAYSFFFDSYNIEDAGTYTFADGVLTLIDANGKETKAEGDPLEFTYAYSKSDQLTGAFTVPAADLTFEAAAEEPAQEADVQEEPAEAEVKSVEILSNDGATRMVFSSDGAYSFFFDSYNIEDAGTYTFADGVLTLIDANGKETKAEGDPLEFTYAYSQSDQLTGAFAVPASALSFTDEIRTVEVPSDDGATRMVFSSDGIYSFFFDSYNIEDAGTYTFTDGVLILTDENGKETKAEGDPIHLHYAYSKSDQLTGEFTIDASDLSFPEDDGNLEISSDDGATRMVFSSDGAYSFFFDSYNIEDAGTYTFADGVLTLTDANGKEIKADGDPIHLHYAYSKSDQLTGEFTIDPALFK